MMNSLMNLFSIIVYLGAVSSFLTILIMLVKKFFGKVLSPKWHYYIWGLLIIRLLLPYTPDSSFSALNLFYMASEHFNLPVKDINIPAYDPIKQINADKEAEINFSTNQTDTSSKVDNHTDNSVSRDHLSLVNIKNDRNHDMPIMVKRFFMVLWMIGMLFLTIYTITINIIFAINVNRNYKPVKNIRMNQILIDCKRILNIKRSITLYTSNKTRTPALYASLHTKILISEEQLNLLNDQEIKYIFLHELSHYKRKDIIINWVLSVLKILYFFHPLLWYAFNKIHEDCEISCDADALRYLKEEEYQEYGSTVIKLIQLYSESNLIPTTAGWGKHKSNYKRRIIMISKFEKNNWKKSILTAILILTVGLIGLTGCKKTDLNTSTSTTTDSSSSTDAKDYNEESTSQNPSQAATEVTATPAPITSAPSSNSASGQKNLEQLAGFIGLSKDDLIAKIGGDYNKVDEGGLEFTKLGIRAWFDAKNITNQIYTNQSDIDFNGAKVGDSIDIFKEKFGKTTGDNSGNAVFQYGKYYLSVYYDDKTQKTFAVYLLREDVAGN